MYVCILLPISDLQMNYNSRNSIVSTHKFSMFELFTGKIKLKMEMWTNAWLNQKSQ